MVYSPETLLNSVTDGFMKVFWNISTKHLHQYSEVYSGILDYLTKNFTADTGTCLQRKTVLKLQIFQKSPCKTVPFLLILQACRPKFPTSTNTITGSEKKIYCKSIEIFANLSGRSLQWSRFIEVTRYYPEATRF